MGRQTNTKDVVHGSSGYAYYVYEAARDVLAQVRSEFGGETVSQYDYTTDAAGRRTEIARSGTAMTEARTDAYGYNARNELTSAAKLGGPGSVPADEYAYQYDDIGNRITSTDLGTNRTYTANGLNQYTLISNLCDSVTLCDDFVPQYDLDGNQTLVKTSTGVWQVSYNGENRPVSWTCGTTNIVMAYDRMGRRVLSRETVGGAVTDSNFSFVYDGYLCIQRLNATTKNVKLIFTWDPLEKVATRPLMVEKPGKYKMHVTHDGNKNVSELVFFSGGSGIAAHYEYAPFGALTASTRSTSVTAYDLRTYNPFRFSSEYADDTLGLVYYTYRHYNPLDGRWTSRDPIAVRWHLSSGGVYSFLLNRGGSIDVPGLYYYVVERESYGRTINAVIVEPKCVKDMRSGCWTLKQGEFNPTIIVDEFGRYTLTNSEGRCFVAVCKRLESGKRATRQHEEKHVKIVKDAVAGSNSRYGLPKRFSSEISCNGYYETISEGWEKPVVKAKEDQQRHTGKAPSSTDTTFQEEYDAGQCKIAEVPCAH